MKFIHNNMEEVKQKVNNNVKENIAEKLIENHEQTRYTKLYSLNFDKIKFKWENLYKNFLFYTKHTPQYIKYLLSKDKNKYDFKYYNIRNNKYVIETRNLMERVEEIYRKRAEYKKEMFIMPAIINDIEKTLNNLKTKIKIYDTEYK